MKGWLIACPFTPKQMMSLPKRMVYRKIIQTGKKAEKLGAKILGLGAYTSVVGDAGVTIEKSLTIPVTTGDSYTIAVAVRALENAAKELQISIASSTAAVVGATGAIGRVCAGILADKVSELYLIGKEEHALTEFANQLKNAGAKARLHTSTDIGAVKNARLIITMTSDPKAIIFPEHLRPGAVVCDIAMPHDVSPRVLEERDDVLVIDGGIVDVPGTANFNFDFGYPPGKAFACMAETIALTLDGRFESFTLGKDISRARVEEIDKIAVKHGFCISSFRSFGKIVSPEQIERIRLRAQAA